MGNYECLCKDKVPDDEKTEAVAFPDTFEGHIERNVQMIKRRQKADLKSTTFQDFVKKRGGTSIEVDETGIINKASLIRLNSYRDEWVYIQLHKEWEDNLILRRKNLDNCVKYADIWRKDIEKTKAAMKAATKSVLDHFNVSSEDYTQSMNEVEGMHVDSVRASIIWKYYPLTTPVKPEILTADEILEILDSLYKLAFSDENLPKLRYSLRKGTLDEKNELVIQWLGDYLWRDKHIRLEDFTLNFTNPDISQESDVREAWERFDNLLSKIPTEPSPLSNPYRKDFPSPTIT
jgi:hypothetical protein